jgi:lysozyme family protein
MWKELKAIVLNKPGVIPAPLLKSKDPVRRWRPPTDYFYKMVVDIEGGYQAHEEDRMNWVGKRLIGTKLGITAYSLAEYLNTTPSIITKEDILKVDEVLAVKIGMQLYYVNPGFVKLDWGPTTEAIVDYGFLSGQGLATRRLQRLMGVTDDGVLGPRSYAAYHEWVDSHGWEKCCDLVAKDRNQYFDEIVKKRPTQVKFRKGWGIRANGLRSSNTLWWNEGWRVTPTVARAT